MKEELYIKASELHSSINGLERALDNVYLKRSLYLEGRTTYNVLFDEFETSLRQSLRYASNERLGRFYNSMIDNFINEMDEIVKELKQEFDSL